MLQLRRMRFIIPHIDGLESPVPEVNHGVTATSAEDNSHSRMFCTCPIDDMDNFRSKYHHPHNSVCIHDRTSHEDLS